MEDLFVTYDQALSLRELGFDEPCLRVGNPNGHTLWKFMDVLDMEGVDIGDIIKEKFDDRFVELPLKQQVLQWIRTQYDLVSWVYIGNVGRYFYTIIENGIYVVDHRAYSNATYVNNNNEGC
jgi:hypothetical protein